MASPFQSYLVLYGVVLTPMTKQVRKPSWLSAVCLSCSFNLTQVGPEPPRISLNGTCTIIDLAMVWYQNHIQFMVARRCPLFQTVLTMASH